jgi:hypothetical protein
MILSFERRQLPGWRNWPLCRAHRLTAIAWQQARDFEDLYIDHRRDRLPGPVATVARLGEGRYSSR